MNNNNSMQDKKKSSCVQMLNKEKSCYKDIKYPEIYYKVQPFIILACDKMGNCSEAMDQMSMDKMAEDVYTQVCLMYPDLEDYAGKYSMKVSAENAYRDRDRDYDNGVFRRRGVFQDFIDLLLLNELIKRGSYIF
ncbi:MAG: hypothetical protein ACK5MV_04625 [Aminipila sp.]